MHDFLNLSWISILVGLLSLAMAIFGVVMTVRARKRAHMTFLSQDIALIGGYATYPDEIEVRYQGVPVPKVMASTVWIWNSGNTTVKGADIVPSDPLRFQFPGDVLNVSVRKVTRYVIGVSARISPKPNTVHWTFEFLDPGDGAVLEVLHVGDAESPKCAGTIIGLPTGLDYWSLGHRRYRWKAQSDASSYVFAAIIFVLSWLFMLVASVMQIFGVVNLERPLPVGAVVLFPILGVGAFLFLIRNWRRWRGLSVPSALDH